MNLPESDEPVRGEDDGEGEERALLMAVQTFLLKLQAEDGARLSGENGNLLRRATAGLGWLRSRMDQEPGINPASTDRMLEQDHRDRARLMAHVAGRGLEGRDMGPEPQPKPDVQRPAPTPDDIAAAIYARTGEKVGIEAITPIWTETSKEIFTIICEPAPGWPRNAILRREPPIAVVATSLVDEYDVLHLTHAAGLPVPRALFAEADPDILGGRVLMLEKVEGKTRTLDEIGDDGPAIVADMAAFLARLHALDPDRVPRFRNGPRSIASQLAQNIAQARAACDEGDRSGLLTAAFDWLDANFAECATEDPAIVHGDFDLRNILIADGRLSSVLDWELSIRGNPAQDLGYCWPHVTQIGDWDMFMAAYVAAGGRRISQRQIMFFAIWAQIWRIAVIVPLWRAFYRGDHPVLLLGSLRYLEQQVYLCDLDRALRLARSLDPLS
ncbi:MAG: phosphotransferase family protein [Sphingobium sp.]